ncbi:MAG: XRE family transcriptional regulator [Chloroflexia bacterium]|nr:XRE family transcriptional regulator [Chloroflexia bacterium]
MMDTRRAFARQIGQRIAHLRQHVGLSQRELAERLGWSRDTIAHYELGRRELGLERLGVLAAALQVSPATLLAHDDQVALLRTLDVHPELLREVEFFLATLFQGETPPLP